MVRLAIMREKLKISASSVGTGMEKSSSRNSTIYLWTSAPIMMLMDPEQGNAMRRAKGKSMSGSRIIDTTSNSLSPDMN